TPPSGNPNARAANSLAVTRHDPDSGEEEVGVEVEGLFVARWTWVGPGRQFIGGESTQAAPRRGGGGGGVRGSMARAWIPGEKVRVTVRVRGLAAVQRPIAEG